MKYHLGIILLAVLTGMAFGQENTVSWITLNNNAHSSLQIDVSTLKAKENKDIYVWGLQSFKVPFKIEGIDSNKIYRVKTYYLINPGLLQYSILKIAYYGKDNRLLREFSYLDDINAQSSGYNYPILPGSDIETIFNSSLKYIRK